MTGRCWLFTNTLVISFLRSLERNRSLLVPEAIDNVNAIFFV